MCVGSGNAANEVRLVLIQADYFADSSEGEQRHTSANAAHAIDGVPRGQLGSSRRGLASIGGAGFASLMSEFGCASNGGDYVFGLVQRACVDELPGDVVGFRGRFYADDVCHWTAIVNGHECRAVADLGLALNAERTGGEKRSRFGRVLT